MQKMSSSQGYRRIILAVCWILGMLGGCLCSQHCGDFCVRLLRQASVSAPAKVSSVSTALLPFLLSALAVSIGEPWLLPMIGTFKAFSFSFCAWGVCLAFGQSSWLVLFLFLFSDFCLIPVLYLYWLRHIQGVLASVWENGLIVLYALFISVLDSGVIAPFLVSILR